MFEVVGLYTFTTIHFIFPVKYARSFYTTHNTAETSAENAKLEKCQHTLHMTSLSNHAEVFFAFCFLLFCSFLIEFVRFGSSSRKCCLSWVCGGNKILTWKYVLRDVAPNNHLSFVLPCLPLRSTEACSFEDAIVCSLRNHRGKMKIVVEDR